MKIFRQKKIDTIKCHLGHAIQIIENEKTKQEYQGGFGTGLYNNPELIDACIAIGAALRELK